MSDIKLCRICLNQKVKMYKLNQYHIASYYEDILNTKENYNDCIWFCFECAMMLQKFHKFKQKCYRGQNALKQLASAGHLNAAVYQSIRKNNNLESNYQLISISSNEKVKSYVYEHMESKLTLVNPDFANDNVYNIQEQKELPMAAEPIVVLERIKIENQNPIVFETIYDEEPNESMHSDEDKHSSDNEINDDNKGMNQNENAKTENNVQIKTLDNDTTEDIKFQWSLKKKCLDPNHWKKITMTEDDVEREFKTKAVDQKYLAADIKCTLCFRLFSRADMLNRHMILRHSKSIGPFECRYCRMRFKWKCNLSNHLKQHYTRYECLRCELSFPVETSAFAHDGYHNGVTRICPHCGKTFRHISTYYTHLRMHRSNVVCTVCGETFVSEVGLKMHKKVKHVLANKEPSKAEQNTYCERCDIKFENRSAYIEHLVQSAKHADTVDNSNDKVDSAHRSLKRPLNTSRPQPTRKNTTCSECGKNFSTYVAFTKHTSEEHPHVQLERPSYKQYKPCTERVLCEICGASVLASSRHQHLLSHTRTTFYTCDICGRRLTSKRTLTDHLLGHAGENPYGCGLCERRFRQNVSLKHHYRTVHNTELAPLKRGRNNLTSQEDHRTQYHGGTEDDSVILGK